MQEIHTAKLFKNGNSQAIRLPKAFRFEGDEVLIFRSGARVIIQPKQGDWDSFFNADLPTDKEFLKERKDTPPQTRDIF